MGALTLGELRALRAVKAGNAVRKYKANGNTLTGEGVSSAALRRLELAGLIRDGERMGAGYCLTLTKNGDHSLEMFDSK